VSGALRSSSRYLSRDIAPARIPCLQQFELDAQHRRLQRVQPRLMTTKRVRETRYPAVVAEQFDPLCQLIIVTGDRTCITPTAQIGLRVEAEASSMGERPGAVPSPLHRDAGAVRLPGILDDLQPECSPIFPSGRAKGGVCAFSQLRPALPDRSHPPTCMKMGEGDQPWPGDLQPFVPRARRG
jgi:hypothetical protein